RIQDRNAVSALAIIRKMFSGGTASSTSRTGSGAVAGSTYGSRATRTSYLEPVPSEQLDALFSWPYACPMPEESRSPEPMPRAPATYDEELLGAETAAVVATQSDAERIERVRKELARGFETLGRIGP